MTLQQKILAACKGNAVFGFEVYWSDFDFCYMWINERAETGRLEFAHWAVPVGYHPSGLDLHLVADFFDDDGGYMGPAQSGVHPVFLPERE